MGPYATDVEAIRQAWEAFRALYRETPVLRNALLDSLAGCELFFKCENLQLGGAFKIRGAVTSVFSLTEEQAARGVVAHSSGNHAGAVARAAEMRGCRAHIVVPTNTPQVKVRAIRGCGVEPTFCEPTMEAREAACAAIQAETGATLIPPYNSPLTITGQGSLGLELLAQVPDLDCVVVPVSGGGLLSGVAIACRGVRPQLRVLAAEPAGRSGRGADVALSKERGEIAVLEKPDTVADGLQARLGDLTWPPIRDLVEAVEVVSEAEIVAATRHCFEHLKLVVEPSGAAALAAALKHGFAPGTKVGVVLTGGNVDPERLAALLAEPASQERTEG